MTSCYDLMSRDELVSTIAALEDEAAQYKVKGLQLDMARGKPSQEQVNLSKFMLDTLSSSSDLVDDDAHADNYGYPDGLPSARALVSELTHISADHIIVNGSSSLNLMHDLIAHGMSHGFNGQTPWARLSGEKKWICLTPGYDRHFAITEHYGFTNVSIPFTEAGLDIDAIRELVEGDASVKGIWCVPRFSNPTGYTYTDVEVKALASLKPAAPDFKIFWDNAYAYHAFVEGAADIFNMYDACAEAGNPDLVFIFGSLAKVTFPGSGLAWVAAHNANFAEVKRAFSVSRVCPEKLSQLAHVRAFPHAEDIYAHMAKHAALLAPRFELVDKILSEGLSDLGIASWSHPQGGYFVSFEALPGCAQAIVSCAKDLGVTLTPAGATWPSGKDPHDTNIRLAPTNPPIADLEQALHVFVLACKLVSARAALAEKAA